MIFAIYPVYRKQENKLINSSAKKINSSFQVSYVKSLDIFLGTCYFIVFASLLEYATIGYLMERYRNSLVDNRATATTCFYELTENSPIIQRIRAMELRNYTFNNESENDFEVPLLIRRSKNQFRLRSAMIRMSANKCLCSCLRIRPSQVLLTLEQSYNFNFRLISYREFYFRHFSLLFTLFIGQFIYIFDIVFDINYNVIYQNCPINKKLILH
ncbi:unnamed protein product [Brugia timori]|uniref:Neur_chan_memb domain-containing protein n=1 Tax=Brugia timori TaxID=42155 RepID=A0A0R3QVH1_9BILA|nr:unnamed protein product [Brugia timori]